MKKAKATNEIKEEKPEDIRRNFLKKFGKHAATVPVVTFILMSSLSSKAIASGGVAGGNS